MALLHGTADSLKRSILYLLFGLSLHCALALPLPLAHWISGETNAETIVLIHGFNDVHETWNSVVPKLAERFRVIVYDQPGHGDSEAEGKDFSPQYMAQQLKNLLDALAIKSAHIVGHSMGGRTALEFASRFPESVKSLLIEDMSALSIPSSVKALPKALEKFDKVKQNIPRTFVNHSVAVTQLSKYYSTIEILWILSSAKTLPNGSVKLANRPEVTELYLHQGLAQDMTAQLKSIKAKTVFFAADPQSGSAVLVGKAIQHIHDTRPDIAIKVFPKVGHMIHYTPQFTKSLLEFLNQ